jgi:phosphatidate phosphatase APP1
VVPATASPTLAWAARTEDAIERRVALLLWRRGWRPQVVPYAGYGAAPSGGRPGWVRILARTLLRPPGSQESTPGEVRGWRNFLTVTLPGVHLAAHIGTMSEGLVTGRGGYVDVVLPADLPPGWQDVTLRSHGGEVTVPVNVVGPDQRLGVVSDIDDTVMITAIPRPVLALWNSFVRVESARNPVPGMAAFLQRVSAIEPSSFLVYLSTGAWNVAPSLTRFLARHGFPRGPLLLTDWGPTESGWFRSGQAHKHATLRRLVNEFPGLTWVLVGDDGQHDPALYDELSADAPGAVRLIAIRELSATEQVLTHGAPVPRPGSLPLHPQAETSDGVVRLHGRDGTELAKALDDPHADAVSRGEPGYTDPETGLFVLTSAYLADRGTCCRRGCRHCPYGGRGPLAPGDPTG